MAAEVATMVLESGVLAVVPFVLERRDDLISGEGNLEDKTRWLYVSIVNTTDNQGLRIVDTWFDSGRFWAEPMDDIEPGNSVTFGVCNTDGSNGGVSGGVGLRSWDVETNNSVGDHDGGWWICTFSNPSTGSVKCLTSWKDYGIKPLWEEMETDEVIRDSRCGCYKKDDNHIVFVWKSPDASW